MPVETRTKVLVSLQNKRFDLSKHNKEYNSLKTLVNSLHTFWSPWAQIQRELLLSFFVPTARLNLSCVRILTQKNVSLTYLVGSFGFIYQLFKQILIKFNAEEISDLFKRSWEFFG